jgi:uncharacterized protein YycO
MIGSVVLYRDETDFFSRGIAYITKNEWTHASIIIGYDEKTNVATVIESNSFIKTRVTTINITKDHVVFTPKNMTEEMSGKVVKYAFLKIGTEYDYFQILGLFISLVFKEPRLALFNSRNKFICSELVDKAYQFAGVHRKNQKNLGDVTPSELLDVYDFEKR